MAASTGWRQPWQDDSCPNQSIQPLVSRLSHTMMPGAHDPSPVARSRQEERKLPPISNAAYSALVAPLSPGATTQQSPSHAASALPHVSRSSAILDTPQQSQPSHRVTHDSSSLRRLSLPPLMYDHSPGEHNNLSLHLESMPTRLAQGQHQHNGLHVQSKRHMSAADLPQVAGLARGASDWAVGRTLRTVKDEERPDAATSSANSEGTHSDHLHVVVQAIVSELAALDNGTAGSPPDWSTKVRPMMSSRLVY